MQMASVPVVHQHIEVPDLAEMESKPMQELKACIASQLAAGPNSTGSVLDFGILLEALLPEDMVHEDCDVWDEDGLLTSVGSELQTAQESQG
jgi:Intraflagellar transport protein 43